MKHILFLCVTLAASKCPDDLHAVYADMHDGDKKEVTILGSSMTVKPSGNNQTWEIKADVNALTCAALVNFNVPGKPGPPPVPLLLTLWWSVSSTGKKTEFEFTDPSGTVVKDKTAPLNRWVEIKEQSASPVDWCPTKLKGVYADMHDGDQKEIDIDGDDLTIHPPASSTEKWNVKAKIESATCGSTVDFNVAGKPNPPPVNLKATLMYSVSMAKKKTIVEFTDPSGKLAKSDFPLNTWVLVEDAAGSPLSLSQQGVSLIQV